MLEKIVKIVNDFQEKYDAENVKLKAEFTRIEKTYVGTSSEYFNAKEIARNNFNRVVDEARNVALEEIKVCAEQDRVSLADVTSKPAPADAVTTIELLKAGNPENTSEFEVKSILEKYKDNYLATKMIIQITNASNRFGIMCSAADDIIREINQIEMYAHNFVKQYCGVMSLENAFLLNGDMVLEVNTMVQNFLNGEHYGTLSESMRREMNA